MLDGMYTGSSEATGQHSATSQRNASSEAMNLWKREMNDTLTENIRMYSWSRTYASKLDGHVTLTEFRGTSAITKRERFA